MSACADVLNVKRRFRRARRRDESLWPDVRYRITSSGTRWQDALLHPLTKAEQVAAAGSAGAVRTSWPIASSANGTHACATHLRAQFTTTVSPRRAAYIVAEGIEHERQHQLVSLHSYARLAAVVTAEALRHS
jgi:hypothetical protein